MATIIEVVVDELCNRAVTITPIIRPQTGLLKILLFLKADPAALPINYLRIRKKHVLD